MAKKAPIKASKVQVAFDAISIEGGLLSPEWLSKIAQLSAEAQTQSDYKVPKGLTLRDEIGRYWRIAEALWSDYRVKSEGLADSTKVTEEFVSTLLKQCLGFDDIQKSQAITIGERVYPVGNSAGDGMIPIVISSPQESLDGLAARFGEDHRKRTAFGLLQEYLNGSENVLWGLVCDGEILRVVRDNASLTKPAWIEADLKRIFQESRYADFAAFWLVCHRTRFGDKSQQPGDCILERWRNACRTEGKRARDHLRIGVEEALELLGQGFISHSDNAWLREVLQAGKLSTQAYFQELLRLIYRVIFLITIEERGLLHPVQTSDSIKELYGAGYSIRRLRDRSIRRNTFDRFSDLWESLKIVFKGIDQGEPQLGLPALGGLFGNDQTPSLMAAKIENRYLLQAVLKLCWLKEASGISRVNWRDMGPEELGSVYEGLLELVPQMTDGGRKFSFVPGDDTAGTARKLTGSYYTPDTLVQSLLDTALEPVIESTIKSNPDDPGAALLRLSIIDPACGSGHFLLAGARRLAGHLSRIQTERTPSAQEYRKALRQVISKCIYGVDKNPMALELARTALWLEAMTPDAPLSFLDHHLVCGDALLGVLDLQVLSWGVPAEAFKALVGDESEVCKQLLLENAKRLKVLNAAREDAGSSPLFNLNEYNLVPLRLNIENMPDDTPLEVETKRIAMENYNAISSNAAIAIAADMFVCAFLAPKTAATKNLIPTTDDVLRALRGSLPRLEVIEFVRSIIQENGVLNWQLEFSQVFSKGGFDIVLGNPPWERIKLQEQEFFSTRSPEIAGARNKAERSRMISALEASPQGSRDRFLFEEFQRSKHLSESASVFFRFGKRFPLTGTGDINTYALFAETSLCISSARGRAGIIVPSGIVTDEATSGFFRFVSNGKLVRVIDYENREGLFPAVDSRQKFALMTLGTCADTIYSSFLTKTEQEKDPRRQYRLDARRIEMLNPNSRTCSIFRAQRDAELTLKIYSNVPVLSRDGSPDGNPWGFDYMTKMFDMADSSHEFIDASNIQALQGNGHTRTFQSTDGTVCTQLYEAKHIHLYNHRWSTYKQELGDVADVPFSDQTNPNFEISTRYWLPISRVEERLDTKSWSRRWLMGWRDVTNSTNERTSIVSIFPRTAVAHTLRVLFLSREPNLCAAFIGILSSLTFDYIARQKLGGTHLTVEILKQLPVPSPEGLAALADSHLVPRILELTYTSESMRGWAADLGFLGDPFPWDENRRAVIKAELDAIVASIYGLDRNELRYVLDPQDVEGGDYPSETFRVLKEREVRQFSEYRTRRLVLEAWDRLSSSGELPNRNGIVT